MTQKPRPVPQVVRLGRPANDNARRLKLPIGLLVAALAAGAVVAALTAA
jgi:hypothetical protein